MIYLYGAGGHAKVVIDILETLKINIGGIIDDDEKLDELLGYKIFRRNFLDTIDSKNQIFVSIGYNGIRKKIVESLHFESPEAIIHPSAIVSKYSNIGAGSVIIQGAIIQAAARLGQYCIVNTGATVGHDCKLENYVHIASNATLCGNVAVGECSWVGAGSVTIPGVKIGRNCLIGAGTVVTKDIPDNVVVVGNPARIIKNRL